MPGRRLASGRGWTVDRFMLIDVALAVLFGGLGVADALGGHTYPGPPAPTAVLVAISALALVWRRRRPLVAFTVCFGAQTVMGFAFGHFDAGSSLLIGLLATLSVAAHGERLRYALAVAALFLVALNFPGQPLNEAVGDLVFTTMFLGGAFAVGLTMKNREDYTSVLEFRAVELEREQEERAAAAAAEERRRIAAELHDIISHSLGLVVLQAGAAVQVLDRDPKRTREALELIRHVGQEAIGEMGTLVGLMRDGTAPPTEPQPSLRDLDRLIATTRKAGLSVDLSVQGDVRPLPPAVELSAFRVVQEGLTNTLKHAGPAHALVCLRYRDQVLEIEVSDDGVGSRSGPGGRHGLAGMRERVAVFGGQFQAGPHPGGGWGVRAAFPVTR
jgi:signal transduction histidine kinase